MTWTIPRTLCWKLAIRGDRRMAAVIHHASNSAPGSTPRIISIIGLAQLCSRWAVPNFYTTGSAATVRFFPDHIDPGGKDYLLRSIKQSGWHLRGDCRECHACGITTSFCQFAANTGDRGNA